MNALLKYRYSFLAGSCAAGGSFFGKLPSFLGALHLLQPTTSFSYLNVFLVQLLPIGLMLICNVCNLRYFLKALQMSQQTLTRFNSCLQLRSVGALVYQEPLTSLSGVGITFILAGLWFLCDSSTDSAIKDETKLKAKQS